MKNLLLRNAAALLLSCGAAAAQAYTLGAVDVTLVNWAFGSGNQVSLSATTVDGTLAYRGHAGAYAGTLSGAGGLDDSAFISWCVELTESTWFGSTLGYNLVAGSDYFGRRHGDAGIAERLGRLMTYADGRRDLVDSASGSTALQLAVWNIVYDSDWSVGAGGAFADASIHGAAANTLLAGAQGVTSSRFDVFALERNGNQDLLTVSQRETPTVVPPNAVAEPGSLALAGLALLGLVVRRRRSS